MPRRPREHQAHTTSAGDAHQVSTTRERHASGINICKDKGLLIDYKDIGLLRRFLSDRGTIRPRQVSGTCRQHQRDIALAVKNAREVALLPYAAHPGAGLGARQRH